MSDKAESSIPRRWIIAAGGAAALGGLGAAWWTQVRQPGAHSVAGTPTTPTMGGPAGSGELAAVTNLWAQSFGRPDGSQLAMSSLRGRPLIINFWATWCAPCVEELPLLNRFFQQHGDKGIQLLGIAADKIENVQPFLQRMPLGFPVVLAGFGGIQLSKALGNLAGGLPFTVVLGKDGAIMQRRMGIVQQEDLQAWATLRGSR